MPHIIHRVALQHRCGSKDPQEGGDAKAAQTTPTSSSAVSAVAPLPPYDGTAYRFQPAAGEVHEAWDSEEDEVILPPYDCAFVEEDPFAYGPQDRGFIAYNGVAYALPLPSSPAGPSAGGHTGSDSAADSQCERSPEKTAILQRLHDRLVRHHRQYLRQRAQSVVLQENLFQGRTAATTIAPGHANGEADSLADTTVQHTRTATELARAIRFPGVRWRHDPYSARVLIAPERATTVYPAKASGVPLDALFSPGRPRPRWFVSAVERQASDYESTATIKNSNRAMRRTSTRRPAAWLLPWLQMAEAALQTPTPPETCLSPSARPQPKSTPCQRFVIPPAAAAELRPPHLEPQYEGSIQDRRRVSPQRPQQQPSPDSPAIAIPVPRRQQQMLPDRQSSLQPTEPEAACTPRSEAPACCLRHRATVRYPSEEETTAPAKLDDDAAPPPVTVNALTRLCANVYQVSVCFTDVVKAQQSRSPGTRGGQHHSAGGRLSHRLGPVPVAEQLYICVLKHRHRLSHAVATQLFLKNAVVVLDGDMGVEMGTIRACVARDEYLSLSTEDRRARKLPLRFDLCLHTLVHRLATRSEERFYNTEIVKLEGKALQYLRQLSSQLSLTTAMNSTSAALQPQQQQPNCPPAVRFESCRVEKMTFTACEFQADSGKLYVYYSSAVPVRFLELATHLHHIFKCRVWISDVVEESDIDGDGFP